MCIYIYIYIYLWPQIGNQLPNDIWQVKRMQDFAELERQGCKDAWERRRCSVCLPHYFCIPHNFTAKFNHFLIQQFASPLENVHNMFCFYLTGTPECLRRARDKK